jgi:hypothetical protein
MSQDQGGSRFIQIEPIEFTRFSINDAIASVLNGFALIVVAICGGVLLIALLGNNLQTIDPGDLWSKIILAGVAFLYNYLFAYVSVRMLERGIGNITHLIRVNAMGYFLGTGLVYAIVIYKLTEQDYGLPRYGQYVTTLLGCFVASILIGRLSQYQDIRIYALGVIVLNLFHLTSIALQYSVFGLYTKFHYFIQEIGILLMVLVVCGFIFNRNWDRGSTK